MKLIQSASFEVPPGRLPLSAGRVTFIRRVSVAGTVTLLSQSFQEATESLWQICASCLWHNTGL